MIRIGVDLDILLSSGISFGNVTGHLDLADIPMPGDSISLVFPKTDVAIPELKEFLGFIKVARRIFLPFSPEEQVLITLDPITINTSQDAQALVSYLKDGFGFISVTY